MQLADNGLKTPGLAAGGLTNPDHAHWLPGYPCKGNDSRFAIPSIRSARS